MNLIPLNALIEDPGLKRAETFYSQFNQISYLELFVLFVISKVYEDQ